jgi:hypothetical protein
MASEIRVAPPSDAVEITGSRRLIERASAAVYAEAAHRATLAWDSLGLVTPDFQRVKPRAIAETHCAAWRPKPLRNRQRRSGGTPQWRRSLDWTGCSGNGGTERRPPRPAGIGWRQSSSRDLRGAAGGTFAVRKSIATTVPAAAATTGPHQLAVKQPGKNRNALIHPRLPCLG